MKLILVLLYILGGQVQLEQTPQKSMDACMKAAETRVIELVKDPRFDEGLFAGCVPLTVQEVQK